MWDTNPAKAGVYQVSVAEGNHNGGWCERLYEREAAKLILYGRALGLSHGEAEDVLHETFMALLELQETPEEPMHYALRAFRNRVMNFKRSLWRRIAREFESIRWFDKSAGESAVERAAMHCLAALPSEQREVIVLKIWSELTFEQIGAMLDLSPNTVAGRYRYGMQKLRICLKENNYEQLELPGNGIEGLETATTLA